jgi:hypothetical protein
LRLQRTSCPYQDGLHEQTTLAMHRIGKVWLMHSGRLMGQGKMEKQGRDTEDKESTLSWRPQEGVRAKG